MSQKVQKNYLKSIRLLYTFVKHFFVKGVTADSKREVQMLDTCLRTRKTAFTHVSLDSDKTKTAQLKRSYYNALVKCIELALTTSYECISCPWDLSGYTVLLASF